MELSTPSIEKDIAELERQLQEKKAALEHDRSEKDILHEIVKEKIQEHTPGEAPVIEQPSVDPHHQDELSDDLKDKVRQMVNVVFEKNLDEGLKEAINSDNPALMDDFHHMLVDELYDQLIEKRKLPKVE